jgi:Kef-type K+ transport system membrane component KefB
MKKMMILGGLVGFLIGMGFGFASQNDWVIILLKACIAAYLAGLMMRWWARMWVRCLRDAFKEKLSQQETASKIPNEMKETKA